MPGQLLVPVDGGGARQALFERLDIYSAVRVSVSSAPGVVLVGKAVWQELTLLFSPSKLCPLSPRRHAQAWRPTAITAEGRMGHQREAAKPKISSCPCEADSRLRRGLGTDPTDLGCPVQP